MGIVYVATSKTSGKRYVGMTTRTLDERISAHTRESQKGIGCPIFHRALRKYGIDDFSWRIVFISDDMDKLYRMEKHVCDLLHTMSPSGYNLSAGRGVGTFSKEARDKISVALKGKPKSESHRKKIIEAARNRVWTESDRDAQRRRLINLKLWKYAPPQVWTDDMKRRISESHLGRKLSAEHVEKVRISHIGKKRSDLARKNMSIGQKKRFSKARAEGKTPWMTNLKPVIRLDDGVIFRSTTEAAREMGVVSQSISAVCRGKTKTCRGHEWMYLGDFSWWEHNDPHFE